MLRFICFFLLTRLALAVEPCRIEIIDKENGWPVPLVELTSTHDTRHVSDNLGLIAIDDPVYPGLPDEQARNPFPFSREPDGELRLHRALAARGLIPIAAWDPDALPVWSRPFAALRAELATELGLVSAQVVQDVVPVQDLAGLGQDRGAETAVALHESGGEDGIRRERGCPRRRRGARGALFAARRPGLVARRGRG